MIFICPECKNENDLSGASKPKSGDIIECSFCGITLMIKSVGDHIEVEVVQLGK